MKIRFCAAALILAGSSTASAQNADQRVQAIVSSSSFRDAKTFLESDHERFVRELIALTEIPAPPFKEQKRGAAYLEMLRAAKLADVETDPEGNVMGVRKGTGSGPMLAVLAHLDTVFPEGTEVTVKRNGNRVLAPGVGDDTGALALMLSVIRAMDAAKVQTRRRHPLRRQRRRRRGRRPARREVSAAEGQVQGPDQELHLDRWRRRRASIVTGGLGSQRYRVTFKGPGGHSYGAFGLVSPAFAMGNAMTKFSRLQVPGHATDDIQRRRGGRRDVGELDSRRHVACWLTCVRSRRRN